MRGDDGVAEARPDDVVRLRRLLLQQIAGSEQTSKFFVVGEMQLDRAVEFRTRPFRSLQRIEREGEACDIALADSYAAPVHATIFHFTAVRIK